MRGLRCVICCRLHWLCEEGTGATPEVPPYQARGAGGAGTRWLVPRGRDVSYQYVCTFTG